MLSRNEVEAKHLRFFVAKLLSMTSMLIYLGTPNKERTGFSGPRIFTKVQPLVHRFSLLLTDAVTYPGYSYGLRTPNQISDCHAERSEASGAVGATLPHILRRCALQNDINAGLQNDMKLMC
jgi:hypothetical protein